MEGHNETSRANLEGLPTEVFQIIVGNLDPKQLKRARLVSRLANAKILHVYKEKLFSNYDIFLFDQESMRQAIKVAKDPELAASIKTLQYGKLQEVEVISDVQRERHFWGDAFYTQMGGDFCPKHLEYDLDGGIQTAIEALSLSRMQIFKFTMGTGMDTVSAKIFNPDHCLSAFQRLETLSLESIEEISDEQAPPHSNKLLFLQDAQQLRNVQVVGFSEFPHALLRTHLPQLENVTIKAHADGSRAEGPRLKDLIDFVKSHANLTSLNLDGIDILDCRKHFRIDDEYREANEQDNRKLQEILGVPGIHNQVFLYP